MSLYATPPFADKTEDERRIRHAQLMYLMGIGDGGLPSGPVIDPRLSFWAPLLTTLVPVKAGNPTFTFQRPTSTAYVRDHEGILRLAMFNEARFQGARRVRNLSSSFIGWPPNNATITPGVADPFGGTSAFTLTATANGGYAQQGPPTFAVGSVGINSIWIKRRTGTGTVNIRNINNVNVDVTAVVTSSWTRVCSPAVAGTLGSAFAIVLLGTSGDAVDVWGAQCEDVSGQSNQAPSEYVSTGVLAAPYHGNAVDGVKYFATTNGNSVAGNIVTEAQGTLIPTATMLGYVAENAATNLCLQSQTFDNASWIKEACTIAADNIAAPDGTLTADRLTDDATNALHRVRYSGPSFSAAAHTMSAYLKAGTLTWAQVGFSDIANSRWANFNLVTGVIGNRDVGTTAAITALPNGWYRCSITATAVSNPGHALLYALNADINSGNPTYVGTGQTMYLWGAQVEASSDPSSYVPTTTVAVLRATDVLEYPMISNLDGTLATTYTEAYTPVARAGVTQSLFTISGGGSFVQFYETTKVLKNHPSSTATANTRTLGAINKNAVAWSGATNSVVLNGGAVATGAFTSYSTTGVVRIAAYIAGDGFALSGTIRNVKFFSSRLTDAELVTMTGP